MSHERLISMEESLIDIVEEQMLCLESVCTKELGEAIDMIKDLEEALYYHTVTQAMLEKYPHESEPEMVSNHKSGISHHQRHAYMEAKEAHMGKAKLLQELEKYMKDLGTDLTEMMEEASAEEKQYLSNRLNALSSKILKVEA